VKKVKPIVRSVLLDFFLGGALVACALLLANLVGPAVGGILAGAPIRTGAVVSLHYFHHRDITATTEMARGVVVAMICNVFFALTLYLALPKWGFAGGLIAASIVFVLAVPVLEYLGTLLKP
jgi:hypothetical protein